LFNEKQLTREPETFKKSIAVYAPVSGQYTSLHALDSSLYSSGLLGPGAAITSSSNRVTAPFDGKVITVSALNYSIDIQSTYGLKCRVKFGSDTTALYAEQFVSTLKAGSVFKKSDVLFSVNTAWLKQQNIENICIMTVLNAQRLLGVLPSNKKYIDAGSDTLFSVFI
jgi:PTS system glucose-specific IIA component